jgi:hypothetical protein
MDLMTGEADQGFLSALGLRPPLLAQLMCNATTALGSSLGETMGHHFHWIWG